MSRHVTSPLTLLYKVANGIKPSPHHQIVAPNIIRSQARPLLFEAVRTGDCKVLRVFLNWQDQPQMDHQHATLGQVVADDGRRSVRRSGNINGAAGLQRSHRRELLDLAKSREVAPKVGTRVA